MSLKRFNADLRSARKRLEDHDIPGIVDLERGEAEGEALITFVHENLSNPILIHAVSANPNSYPDDNNFLYSTDSRLAPATVTSALDYLQNFNFGLTVFETLRDISTGLTDALKRCHVDQDGDTIMNGAADGGSASEDQCSDEHWEDSDYDEDEDPIFGFAPLSDQTAKTPRKQARTAPDVLHKIRRDLRKAREAGAKIGVFYGVDDQTQTHMISLSIRARKLGISDEALEAWDVDPADYIVLLLRIEGPYPTAEDLVQRASSSYSLDFRFGKCKKSKPSPDSARKAFHTKSERTASMGEASGAQVTDPMADSHPFNKLFISNSMEQFMNEHFLALTKLRLTGDQSWDDANLHILDLFIQQSPDKGKGKEKGKAKEEGLQFSESSSTDAPEQRKLPTILVWDSFTESATDISIPLVAMQFALHYFVRCTEYCLRCHRRVKKEFEALKPFVCEDPLCLFQYITMGFGPSIEHEILSQPYVVDLLITLCYSSIQDQNGIHVPNGMYSNGGFPIRDFPKGLRLKVASLPPLIPPHHWQAMGAQPQKDKQVQYGADPYGTPIKVRVDFDLKTMSAQIPEDIYYLAGNSWVVLQHFARQANGVLSQGQALVHQAYLKSVDRLTNKIEFDMKNQDLSLLSVVQPGAGPQTVDLYKYDYEFDDLDDAGKARGMRAVLATIPPISHLREYLIKNPHSRLRSYPGISPSAATLLEWIVASNRSFILQVNQVNDVHSQDADVHSTIKTREQEVIPSLNKNYIQFRFAMGNPDKELRFQRALKDLEARQNPFPTLFAWHGSALQNWHSILRQGLDFKKVANGRAYGDGVYFSPCYATSQTYMRAGPSNWPNSALHPSGVIALCEIINAPDQFRSTTPHYVVSQVDWIQCRYLFVQSAASLSMQTSNSTTSSSTVDEFPQDPNRKVIGPNGGALKIPRKALPSSRAGIKTNETFRGTPSKRSHDSLLSGEDTDEEDAADLAALFSDGESSQPPRKRVQPLVEQSSQNSLGECSADTVTARQLTAQQSSTPQNQCIASSMTDFRPGTLDLKSIPQLALPQWANASSSKRLASDIKLMQKVQETTPLHELGWYIDFSNIDNMFQWVVELHTFDPELPLAKDMKKAGVTSIVLEIRFGRDYPLSPPFVRVIRPKFLPFMEGGGGHVTIGGAICLEILTNTGWTVAMSMESVLVQVKMAMSSLDPQPARLQKKTRGMGDYSPHEAVDAFQRFANRHNWKVPSDFTANATRV